MVSIHEVLRDLVEPTISLVRGVLNPAILSLGLLPFSVDQFLSAGIISSQRTSLAAFSTTCLRILAVLTVTVLESL